MSFSLGLVVLLVAGVLFAGAVTGIAGFGFALIGTMLLATFVEPSVAVVFMILPILAVNASLVRELSLDDLESCTRRFAPLMAAALVGTLLGLAALDWIPTDPLRVGLGLVSLAFVGNAQNLRPLPGIAAVEERCFVETPGAMAAVGGISGLLFGATNVGVQLIAYFRSCQLGHGLFVGVIAMVFLGLNGARFVAAGVLGLYPSTMIAGLSVVAGIPAVAGVLVGKRFRDRIDDRYTRWLVLSLLTVIGGRLVLAGLGIA